MTDNNTEPKVVPEIPEEDEFLYIPDYGPDLTDSSDDEAQIKKIIDSRECNIEEYVMPDMNIFQRMGEFWYRNKPLILAAAGAVALLLFVIITAIPEHYDLTSTIYVSYSDFPSTISFEMQEDFDELIGDWNEDGEVKASVSTINLVDRNGIIAITNMDKLLGHLTDKPTSMLWIVDEDLYAMMVRDYGEELFESFEGAPLWIEITFNETITSCIERSECPRLGFCLRALTDELAEDEDVCEYYEHALQTLSTLKAQYPEMFEAQ